MVVWVNRTIFLFIFFIIINNELYAREYKQYSYEVDIDSCQGQVVSCYSSKAKNIDNFTPPLRISWPQLKAVIRSWDDAVVVKEKPGYLRVQFMAGFVFKQTYNIDFIQEPETDMIHFRSVASSIILNFGMHEKKLLQIYNIIMQASKKRKTRRY